MSKRNFCGPNRDDHWWGTWQDYDPAMPPYPYHYYRKCTRSGCDAREDVERLVPEGESRITPVFVPRPQHCSACGIPRDVQTLAGPCAPNFTHVWVTDEQAI